RPEHERRLRERGDQARRVRGVGRALHLRDVSGHRGSRAATGGGDGPREAREASSQGPAAHLREGDVRATTRAGQRRRLRPARRRVGRRAHSLHVELGALRGAAAQGEVRVKKMSMVHGAEATKLMEAARALRPRILADRQRIESGRRLPEDLAHELARAGFFRIYLPQTYGGLDLTPMAATEIFEELARADASVAWCV